MWNVVILYVGVASYTLPFYTTALHIKNNASPVIPTNLDSKYVQFQNAVNAKQLDMSIPALYATLAAYKKGFDKFKTTNTISGQSPTGIDTDFAAFQKFVTKYFRTYNNMDEFETRYKLFMDVLNKYKGYNDGNDMAGINHLSDRTNAEKKSLYG